MKKETIYLLIVTIFYIFTYLFFAPAIVGIVFCFVFLFILYSESMQRNIVNIVATSSLIFCILYYIMSFVIDPIFYIPVILMIILVVFRLILIDNGEIKKNSIKTQGD